jgi:hyaluronoglucosaminidase
LDRPLPESTHSKATNMRVSVDGSLSVLATLSVLIGSMAAAPPPPGHDKSPQIWPTPQHQKWRSDGFKVPINAALITSEDSDKPALRVVQEVLKDAGVERFVADCDDKDVLRVYVGGPTENNASASALYALGLQGPEELTAEGYVLGIGRDAHKNNIVVLSGHDPDGTFYAAQSLRQLFVPHHGGSAFLPGVEIRDWPVTPIRGSIEIFYGVPWSTEDRLDQFDFYAQTKQNTYIYSSKDDPYLRAEWREPYPAEAIATLKQLAERAIEDHVDFVYAVSPGLDVCYSSREDEDALISRFQSMWDIGIRAFNIPFDDVDYEEWSCPEDEERWGTGGAAAAHAQSYLVNKVLTDFIDTHDGARPLQMVVTEYKNVTETPYRAAIREALDPRVIVFWTGPITVTPTITALDAMQAEEVFAHPILIGDNYPVNDYTYQRLLLGPYTGREHNMTEYVEGVTLNPMPQAQPSKVSMFTAADFLWNSEAYDKDTAWLAALEFVAGPAWPTLKVFAENSYSSVLDERESLVASPLIDRFWESYNSSSRDLGRNARELSAYFHKMATTPRQLEKEMENQGFVSQLQPWLNKLGVYGEAGQIAVKALVAQRAGHKLEVREELQTLEGLRYELDNFNATACPLGECRFINPIVAPGVMELFLNGTMEAIAKK